MCINSVTRGGACNEAVFQLLILNKSLETTPEQCGAFYRKMLRYIQMEEAEEVLNT